jgi:hypothetical protein
VCLWLDLSTFSIDWPGSGAMVAGHTTAGGVGWLGNQLGFQVGVSAAV